jgi:hypothetical protein
MQHVSAGHYGLQLNLSGTKAYVRQTDMQRKKPTNKPQNLSKYLTGEAEAAKG